MPPLAKELSSLGSGPLPVCEHVCAMSASSPANVPSHQGTFGREPAAVKPDDDRYLRAAIQEYDNIAKLGQIIREGPIKVSPPYRLLHLEPWLSLEPPPEDAGTGKILGKSFLHLQAQLDLPSTGARPAGQ